MENKTTSFIWDPLKELINIRKHGIDFVTAARAFKDPKRKVLIDSEHSKSEPKYFCVGKVDSKIITVRFTYRSNKIRIIGAGCWRKGAKYYEEKEN
jgi:uncharacterized DUF497 family protein